MLIRQRVILQILRRLADGNASRLQLTKLAFLVSQETETGGGNAFYEFLPYRYGPYSFTLYHEMNTLIRNGLVEEADKHSWSLTRAGEEATFIVPDNIRHDVEDIVEQYGNWPVSQLTNRVYQDYPRFTINSEKREKRSQSRPVAEPAIYSVGYEGHAVDGFLDKLIRDGITHLIDVRNNPISRRYGFHKSTLSRLCSYLDIEYLHFPKLGIASEHRSDLDSFTDYQQLFAFYESEILPARDEFVEDVAEIMAASPSALMCREADPTFCHRSKLAQAVALKTNLPVIHLE